MSEKAMCRVSFNPNDGKKHMAHYCKLESGHTGDHQYGACELCQPGDWLKKEAQMFFDMIADMSRAFTGYRAWKDTHSLKGVLDCCLITKGFDLQMQETEEKLIEYICNSTLIGAKLERSTRETAYRLRDQLRNEKGKPLRDRSQPEQHFEAHMLSLDDVKELIKIVEAEQEGKGRTKH